MDFDPTTQVGHLPLLHHNRGTPLSKPASYFPHLVYHCRLTTAYLMWRFWLLVPPLVNWDFLLASIQPFRETVLGHVSQAFRSIQHHHLIRPSR